MKIEIQMIGERAKRCNFVAKKMEIEWEKSTIHMVQESVGKLHIILGKFNMGMVALSVGCRRTESMSFVIVAVFQVSLFSTQLCNTKSHAFHRLFVRR